VEHQLERLRSLDPLIVDTALAVVLFVIGVVTVYTQELVGGLHKAPAAAVLTLVVMCAPVAVRRRWALPALLVSCAGILVHIMSNWPEGAAPMAVLLLTYTVGSCETPRRAGIGLGATYLTLVLLRLSGANGLDTGGMVSNILIFTVGWTIGVALRARREALEERVRSADERANVERQSAARALAEERLRIAQELHDVVAHSMSVIAVQAGVGAHVLADRPEQALAALNAISATSRGTLAELRRLLGVLRDADGERSHAPAPGLGDLPQLVEDVRSAGVPVTLSVTGQPEGQCANSGVELSAYRVVQEALTNVIKHAGAPTSVEVNVQHRPGTLAIDVVDDGRGAATIHTNGLAGSGHGLLGMRERVELWGGELAVGPVDGGGYRVSALLPFGEAE
jgi:signal transduction histidine kinase